MKFILSIIAVLFSGFVFGQILDPVKWSYDYTELEENKYEVSFTAKIQDGWWIYGQDVSVGPVPTDFFFDKSEDFSKVGELIIPTPKNKYDKNFEADITYYKHEVTFKQVVHSEKVDFAVKGELQFMSCDTTQCLPPAFIPFEVLIGNASGSVKKNDDLNQSEQVKVSKNGESRFCWSCKENPEVKTFEGASIDKGDETEGLFSFWFVAFLYGLGALLTPCVFPMIPMTVSFFMKDAGGKKSKGIRNGLIFGISVILIYCLVGTLFSWAFGADAANLIATHWIPNTIFFAIFIVFAISFFGAFEMRLPASFISKVDAKADKGGLIGVFFMAFTLVIVSFSCTGPLIGSVLVQSAQGVSLKPLIGMFGFSAAFALPFTIFAIFPGLMNNLPKSGGWLNSVKVVFGFLELALGLKFLSIADQTEHWGLLDRDVYIALWIVIFFLMGVYLLGKLKFSHDSDLPYLKVPRLLFAVATFTFVVYLIPGMWGAPLKALSGYLPPMSSHDFNIVGMLRGEAEVEVCEDPKFGDQLHLPHGLKGYFEYEQGMECAAELNKPVFFDFTGHGCVNCREMEANVWSDPEILKLLQEEFVIVALYVDDHKIKLEESERFVAKFDNKKTVKTIGDKNADIEKTFFTKNSQPYYCLMDENEELLNIPIDYAEGQDVTVFKEFLLKGIAKYKERQVQGLY